MNNRLLVVATSGEVGEGARVFHAKVASHERGASGEGSAQSSDDPISFTTRELAPYTEPDNTQLGITCGAPMARLKQEKVREYRIAMEAVVDAYNEGERATGWYYYLEGKLKFPFKARCKAKRAVSPLGVGEEVEVLGMAPEDECESEMFVWILYSDNHLAVPLAQLESLSKDRETQEAVGDWHYWVAQGYEF